MEIKVEITKDDFGAFNKYYYRTKLLKNKYVLTLLIIFILGLTLTLDSGNPIEIGLFVGDFLLITITFIPILGISVIIMLNLVKYYPAKNGSIVGKKKYVITTEGLIDESEKSKTSTKWSAILSVEQSNKMIYIFVDNIAAYIVPKRYFDNKEHINKFLNQIKEKRNLC